jgi:tight adherence protein B
VTEPEDAVIGWASGLAIAVVLTAAGGGGPVGAALVAGGVLLAPFGVLRWGRARRERRLAASVPVLVDRIAAELRAGGTLPGAISRAADSDLPLADDLRWIDARARMGLPLADALAAWPRRREIAGVVAVAGALAMCATVGGRAADALDGLAAACRDRLAVAAEAGALSAQARASAIVVGGAPIAVLAWSALTGGSAIRTLLATPVGWMCAVLGIGLEVVGAWWMHRIIRSGSAG